MAEVIIDRELKHGIETLIAYTETFIFLVSPYIDLDEDLKKAFSKLKPEIIKTIVYRKSDSSTNKSGISNDSRLFLKSLANVELVSVKNLHAKIYINEKYTVISSMNLTSSSNHNYEIGVKIENEIEYEMFEDSLAYLVYILRSDDSDISDERLKNIIPKQRFVLDYSPSEVKINGKSVDLKIFESLHKNCNTKHGYCIRCESTKIEFYPNRPLCPKCYAEWSKYKNHDYQETCCHRCGMEINTDIRNPLCDSCSDIYNFEIEREWKKIN
jgi:hypothetical protein